MSHQGFGIMQAMNLMVQTNNMSLHRRRHGGGCSHLSSSSEEKTDPVLHTSGTARKTDPLFLISILLIAIPTTLLMMACYAMSLSATK